MDGAHSNVLFMENMFAGCSNLTNLDISGFNTSRVATFDMSKGANVTELFAQCNNLKQIITPKITGSQSVSLPEGVWRGSDGNTYQTIPQNATNSITLTKE